MTYRKYTIIAIWPFCGDLIIAQYEATAILALYLLIGTLPVEAGPYTSNAFSGNTAYILEAPLLQQNTHGRKW